MTTEEIINIMNGEEPVSIIRCGDGEKVVLDGPDNPDYKPTFIRDLGYYDEGESLKVRENLIKAIRECDILGVPRHNNLQEMGDDWRNVEETIDRLIPGATKKRCSINIHLDLLDHYERFLTGKSIALIGCRDLTNQIKEKFKTNKVDWFGIAPELKFTSYSGTKHYPDQFNQVKIWMNFIEHKSILLVGAGRVGKIYCNWWRDKGGRALDVGSVMDEWAGRVTRGPERGFNKFKRTKYTL